MIYPFEFDELEVYLPSGEEIKIEAWRSLDLINGQMLFVVKSDDIFKNVFGKPQFAWYMYKTGQSLDQTNDLSSHSQDQVNILKDLIRKIRQHYSSYRELLINISE